MRTTRLITLALLTLLLGCAQDTPDSTAFAKDAGPADVGATDTGALDVESSDSGSVDSGPVDSGPVDTGSGDTGPVDSGPADTGPADTGPADTGPLDSGPADTGPSDTGPVDTGPVDSGPADTGPADTSGCASSKDCDDGKACTIDLCNPASSACEHKPHTGACDDGDPCTLGDVCDKGACAGPHLRYVRRIVGAKTKVSGGHVAESGGVVAFAGRSQSRPVVYGLDAGSMIDWTAWTAAAGVSGAFHTLMPTASGFAAAGWRGGYGSTTAAPYIAHVGKTGTVLMTGTLAVNQVVAEIRGLVPGKTAGLVHYAGLSHDSKGNWRAIYGKIDLNSGKLSGVNTTLGASTSLRAGYGLVKQSTRDVIFGWTSAKGAQKQAWIQALDRSTGFTLFQKGFGTKSTDEVFQGAAGLPDGGLLLAGHTTFNGSSSTKLQVWLVRTDAQGDELWSRHFGTDADDFAQGVMPLGDGGAVLVGASAVKGATQGLGTVWRVDAWGNVLWQRGTNLSGNETLASVVQGTQGWLIGGSAFSPSSASLVYHRTDAFAHWGCGASGVCAGKAVKDCDDGKPCTADDCAAGTGCSHAPLTPGATCGSKQTCSAGGVCQ